MKRRFFLSAMAASLSGCAVGPDFLRPFFETPVNWRVDLPQATAMTNMRWWQSFGDPVLDSLVEQALRDNLDMRIAAARVDRFLGQLSTTRSQFFPQIGYGLEASRNRTSERGVTPLPSGTDPWYKLYQGSLGAAWQIDLFGRVRRQSEAAQARVFASEQGRRGTLLSVVSAVAAGYVNLRALDRQLEIARSTASNYEKTLRIFQLRFKGGVVSQTELSQSESQYELARAAVPGLERQIAAQENLLSILLGRVPGPIPRGQPIGRLALPEVPPGLPSSLIDRRPDVLQAEQNLVAANAGIGVARSLYFPDISLTSTVGSVSAALSNFLSGPSTVALLAANIAGPVFTFGNIEGQVRSAEAANEEALADYQLTILNALRDTNDALVGTQKSAEVFDAQNKRVKALREYARLSRLKYENGSTSYLEVLYAEENLFSAELSAVDSEADRLTMMISVYRALGGGWVDAIDPAAPATPAETR